MQGIIIELDDKGRGVFLYPLAEGKGETRRVLVPFTAVGDTVEVTFCKRDQGHWIAKLEQIIASSPDRVSTPCPHAGICGGCLWQHLDYTAQVTLKKGRIEQTFAAAEIPIQLEEVTPSKEILYYRNRMDFAFGWQGELGMKEYGSWSRYVNTTDCILLDEETPKILAIFREFVTTFQIPVWDAKKQTGLSRYVVIRRGHFTNERLILYVVKDLKMITAAMKEELVRRLRDHGTSIIVGENPEITDLSYVKTYEVLHGNDLLTEEINTLRYRIHPNSFFQTNSAMAGTLQNRVLDLLGPIEGKTVLDLYCGLGFFGIACARKGATVAGHELDAAAIELAKENALLNGVSERTHFSAGAVESYAWEIDKPDLVIVDPPRSGLHPKALETLMEKAPPVIVYVSCNYARLVGELKTLLTKYRLESIQAIDLFPQTPHVEVLVKLVRT